MKREFVCRECHGKPLRLGVTALKGDPGFFRRATLGLTKQPEAQHREIAINGVKQTLPLDHFNCDWCDTPIKPGSEAIALTTWKGENEGEPRRWEEEYLITDPAVIGVAMASRLRGETP